MFIALILLPVMYTPSLKHSPMNISHRFWSLQHLCLSCFGFLQQRAVTPSPRGWSFKPSHCQSSPTLHHHCRPCHLQTHDVSLMDMCWMWGGHTQVKPPGIHTAAPRASAQHHQWWNWWIHLGNTSTALKECLAFPLTCWVSKSHHSD